MSKEEIEDLKQVIISVAEEILRFLDRLKENR